MLMQLNILAEKYEYLIKAIGAFLPFLIAIFMAYIAYQQWQTNERKRRQDLYDKRYEFYEVILNKINEIEKTKFLNNADISPEEYKLNELIDKYEFLISKTDQDLVTELLIWTRGMQIKYPFKKKKLPYFGIKYNEYKRVYIEYEIKQIFEKYLRIEQNFFQTVCPRLYNKISEVIFKSCEFDLTEMDEYDKVAEQSNEK